jgi:hypothetical protein
LCDLAQSSLSINPAVLATDLWVLTLRGSYRTETVLHIRRGADASQQRYWRQKSQIGTREIMQFRIVELHPGSDWNTVRC